MDFDCIYKKIRKKRQLYIYVTLQTSLLKQELFVVHVLETSLLKQEFPIKGSIFRAPHNCYEKKVWTVSVNNSTNINKTKESLNSERQQFHQYQQNKRKFEQWASTIPPISTKQKKVWTVMVNNSPISTKQKKVWTVSVNNSTNINKTKESLNSERQQFHQYQQNKRKFEQWASTIPPISTKQKKV